MNLLCRCPTYQKAPINLFKLFNLVQQHGGFDMVSGLHITNYVLPPLPHVEICSCSAVEPDGNVK